MEKLYHIGRDKSSNEIFIIDDSISLSHAQVFVDQNIDLTIIDLSSKNGVFVNNNKINAPLKLQENDTIVLGSVSFNTKQLLNAIKVYESNSIKENIPLIKSYKKVEIINRKKINSKKIFYILFLAFILVAIVIGGYFFNKQNIIRNKIEIDRSNSSEKIELTEKLVPKTNTINKPLLSNTIKQKNIINKQKTGIVYDFSCLSSEEDQGTNELILEVGNIKRDIENTLFNDVEISINDEKNEGNDYVNSLKKEKKFITSGRDYSKLNRIMKDLISNLANPRGVDYEMFFIDDEVKNVVTIGGNIIFYKGMYDFCKNDSELAVLISHEIAHNEFAHSKIPLKKQKAAETLFGNLSEIFLETESVVSASFNQKQESEADMFGIDLMIPSNYDNCASVDLLKRFSANDADFDVFKNLFTSHPYSKNRLNCLNNHLKKNYNINCK